MKKIRIILICFPLVLSMSASFGQEAKFQEAMKKNIVALYTAESQEGSLNAVNVFERIASAEKTRWEPFYYTAFGYVQLSFKEQDVAKKEEYLKSAQTAIDKANELKKNDSEITALDGFVTMMEISIDPGTRGQSLSGIAMNKFGKAVALNPKNPRAVLLQAQMQMGVDQFFGNAPTEACKKIKEANELFATETPKDLAPVWGKKMAEGLLAKCN